jgi:hypothetical protein
MSAIATKIVFIVAAMTSTEEIQPIQEWNVRNWGGSRHGGKWVGRGRTLRHDARMNDGFRSGVTTGGLAGAIAAAICLFLMLPVVGIIGFVTGGCEGAPQPCRSNGWPFLLAGMIALGLSFGSFVLVRRLVDRRTRH